MIVSEYRAPLYLPPACVGYRELMPPARGRRARTAAADAGSVYEPLPTLTYHWDPDQAPSSKLGRHVSTRKHGQSFDLGPHPADPLSIVSPASPSNGGENGFHENGKSGQHRSVQGAELYVHYGNGGWVREAPLSGVRL